MYAHHLRFYSNKEQFTTVIVSKQEYPYVEELEVWILELLDGKEDKGYHIFNLTTIKYKKK